MPSSSTLNYDQEDPTFIKECLNEIDKEESTANNEDAGNDFAYLEAIRKITYKFGVTQYTQHRLYSHNTFILQINQLPE